MFLFNYINSKMAKDTVLMKTGKFIRKYYFLPFKWLYKLFIFAIFMIYISFGSRASWILLKSALINLQPVNALHSIIEKNAQKDNTASVTEWIRRRPISETSTLIEIATPKSGILESRLFLEFSRRCLKQGKIKEALFWAQLARYRIRYDSLRCGSLDTPEFFDKFLSEFTPYQLTNLIKLNPELVKESIRQVIEFDTKYPANNNPASICIIFNKIEKRGASIAPKDQWERLHRNLRMVTEAYLESSDEK